MRSSHPRSDLPPALLRALGELYIAVVELDRALAGPLGLGGDPDGRGWRDRAGTMVEEARRVATACASAVVSGDAVLIRSVDGSTVSMSAANVERLAKAAAEHSRRARALDGGGPAT